MSPKIAKCLFTVLNKSQWLIVTCWRAKVALWAWVVVARGTEEEAQQQRERERRPWEKEVAGEEN